MKKTNVLIAMLSTAILQTVSLFGQGSTFTEPMVQTGLEIGENFLSLNSGVYLITPYEIDEDAMLQQSGSDAVFYFEFVYNTVLAWSPARRHEFLKTKRRFIPFSEQWEHMDLQARMGYFHHGDDDPTATAIVGAGDFSVETTITYPLLALSRPDLLTAASDVKTSFENTDYFQTLGLVASFSGTTDRSAYDIHRRLFFGAGYKASMNVPGSKREALVSLQMGPVWVDTIQFVNGASRTVKMTNGDIPKYDMESGWALESEIYYPVRNQSYLTLGTRIYTGYNPNPWNAYIGLTWSIDNILKWFPQ